MRESFRVPEAKNSVRQILASVASGEMQYIYYYFPDSGLSWGHDYFKTGAIDQEALDAKFENMRQYAGREQIQRYIITQEEAQTGDTSVFFPPSSTWI